MKIAWRVFICLAFFGLMTIAIFQYLQIEQLKLAFEEDSRAKALQIQRLDAGISFQSKKEQFISLARDSIIMKHNRKITHEEAFDIAEFNLYVSEKYKLDPILLLAIQRQESAFRKNAVSKVGAIGLNQIYPVTGRMLCDAMGIEYHPKILYDTKVNTELGAKYLSYLRAEYEKLDYMLIGYNAGPSWVSRHKRGRELPLETQDYIAAVRKFYRQFGEKLACYLPGNLMQVIENTDTIQIDMRVDDILSAQG